MATQTLVGVSGGFDIMSGLFGKEAADAEASSLRSQAALLKLETEAEISRYAESARVFQAKQKLAYMKSGVALEGSPLDILDETVRVSAENINAMRAKGTAQAQELMGKAAKTKAAGRTAFVSGIGGAVKKVSEAGTKYGWFSKAKPEPQYPYKKNSKMDLPSPTDAIYGPKKRFPNG